MGVFILSLIMATAVLQAGISDVPARSHIAAFQPCGAGPRVTCIVDGDTFWLDGQKVRVADINTPEISRPRCALEKAKGDKATARMMQLLNQGPFELARNGRDEDRYGRKLRIVMRGGQSLGDTLIEEGLAEPWTGQRKNWC